MAKKRFTVSAKVTIDVDATSYKAALDSASDLLDGLHGTGIVGSVETELTGVEWMQGKENLFIDLT